MVSSSGKPASIIRLFRRPSRQVLKMRKLAFIVCDVFADGFHLLAVIRIDARERFLPAGKRTGETRHDAADYILPLDPQRLRKTPVAT